MALRRLGRTGLDVSRIALGTVKIGRNTGVKYPAPFDLPSDADVARLLDAALEIGVNLLDTAPAYGTSEERLRPWRKRFLVCTKVGETHEGGRSTYDFSPAAVKGSVERSLRRLATDCVDVLLLHSDGNDLAALAAAGETMLEMKTSGKARAVGLSAKTAAGVAEAARALGVVMAPWSAADPSLGPALAAASKAGAGILAIKALASGHAKEPTAALRFAAEPFVDSIVVGTLNPDHLRSAVKALEGLETR
jgi:aryl-alcohol dehydrogenase-like predicted oxidoreductase